MDDPHIIKLSIVGPISLPQSPHSPTTNKELDTKTKDATQSVLSTTPISSPLAKSVEIVQKALTPQFTSTPPEERLRDIQEYIDHVAVLPTQRDLQDFEHPEIQKKALESLRLLRESFNEVFEISSLLGIPVNSDESQIFFIRTVPISAAFLSLLTKEKTNRKNQPYAFEGILMLNHLFNQSLITPDEIIQNVSRYYIDFPKDLQHESLQFIQKVLASPLAKPYEEEIQALMLNEEIHDHLFRVWAGEDINKIKSK